MVYKLLLRINRSQEPIGYFLMLAFLSFFINDAQAQSAEQVLQEIKQKLDKVNDYEAAGKMKTNVAFIKTPVANVKVYYKKPDMVRIINESGISFIPKGSVNISLNNIFANLPNFDLIDAGNNQEGLRVIKVLPKNDTADIVLSTLYIDEKKMLILKSNTTTRENGSYELMMSYGKYADYSLPDRIIFSFNTKDYKLPKGITLDYDEGSEKNNDKLKNKKGTVEIVYSGYSINKGIDNKIFQR